MRGWAGHRDERSMEHLKAEAVRLVSDRLGEASTGGEGEAEEGRGNLEPGVNYRQTGSAPRHGDLYFSRRTAEKLVKTTSK